jgi:Flp pilus assembly protein TadD
MTTETLLQQGIVAAQAGRREEARALLMQVVQADERSEQAWLWLSGVVDDPDDMRTCLQNVLDLNPGNEKAQQGLAWVDSRYGPPTAKAEPEPVAAQEPTANTGATIKLAAEVVPPTPEPAAQPQEPPKPAAQPHLPPAEAAAPASNPCPYCGTSTLLNRKSCHQCHNSLMMRTAPNEKRSVATTILAILWGLSGVLTILSGLATVGVGIYIGTVGGRGLARQLGLPSNLPLITRLLPGIVILLLGGLSIALMRGLMRRARWAYVLNIVSVTLSVLIILASMVLDRMITEMLASNRTLQGGNATGSLFCNVIVLIGHIVLTILSYRDFYGAKVRFQPEVDTTDHMGHFNNGLAYKKRGMWHMAMREWEAAVSKSPKDLDYLHALGLAYAQVKQFTKARETLDTALSLAPSDARLQESRAVVDRLATQRR